MQMKNLIITISALLFISSCGNKKIPQSSIELGDLKDTFSEPNRIYKPGDIVSRDKETGRMIKLTSINVKTLESKTKTASFINEVNSNLGVIFNFLGIEDLNLNADAGFNSNRKLRYLIKMEGTSTETIDGLLNYNEELKKIKSDLNEKLDDLSINMKKNEILFLTEIRKAKKIQFQFGKNVLFETELKAKFEEIASLKGGYDWNENSDYQLTFEDPEPYNISYSKLPIDVISGIGGRSFVIKK